VAAGEGRIDFEELDDRLGRAYSAKTYGQLRALVQDLRITAETTSGFITIGFTRATCTHREVAVEAVARSGWIRLILPEAGPPGSLRPALGRPGRAGQHEHLAHQQQGARDRGRGLADDHRDGAPGIRHPATSGTGSATASDSASAPSARAAGVTSAHERPAPGVSSRRSAQQRAPLPPIADER
jgi:DUF1707 SHOCT-like domain